MTQGLLSHMGKRQPGRRLKHLPRLLCVGRAAQHNVRATTVGRTPFRASLRILLQHQHQHSQMFSGSAGPGPKDLFLLAQCLCISWQLGQQQVHHHSSATQAC